MRKSPQQIYIRMTNAVRYRLPLAWRLSQFSRRIPYLLIVLLVGNAAAQQSPPAGSKGAVERAVERALTGAWAGYLEYRDYSEPAASTKRVQLPTWLDVSPTAGGLSLHYIYDDGPGKVVDETEQLSVNAARRTYTTTAAGHLPEVCGVEGYDKLRDGLGKLVLTCGGTDDGKPSEQRLTVSIRRNIVEWLLETRPAGTSGDFAFRHLYRLTRAEPPRVTAPRK
jgi:hypothetical protein